MKPIKPLSREEKERRRRLAEAKEARKALLDKGPPDNRISVTGASFLGSDAAEWVNVAGVGWYHISEQDWFDVTFRMCIQNETYHRREEMFRTLDNDFIHKSELGKTWVIEVLSQKCIPAAEAVECCDAHGKKAWTCEHLANDEHYFVQCDATGGLYPKNHVRFLKHPVNPAFKRVCHAAIRLKPDLFMSCPNCGNLAEIAGVKEYPEIRGRACNDCYQINILKNIIHPYNYDGFPPKLSSNPTVKMLVGNPLVLKDVPDETHRLYGVECEVEIHDNSPMSRWQLAESCTKTLGKDFVVMKNDGSLKAHPRESDLWGFEIVSAPADFATHEAKWAKLETMEGFKYLRAWDTITCGLHIHVGKAALSLLQVGRILVFINAPANRKFVEKVAGRNSAAASRFLNEKTVADGLRPDPDKYCALNIRPKNTIEFRIFRGTIRYKHIMRNLEFVDAVCTYCYPAARSLQAIKDYKQFILFCRMNRKRYPRLAAWLEDQKFIPARKLPKGHEKEEVVEAEPVVTESQGKWY